MAGRSDGPRDPLARSLLFSDLVRGLGSSLMFGFVSVAHFVGAGAYGARVSVGTLSRMQRDVLTAELFGVSLIVLAVVGGVFGILLITADLFGGEPRSFSSAPADREGLAFAVMATVIAVLWTVVAVSANVALDPVVALAGAVTGSWIGVTAPFPLFAFAVSFRWRTVGESSPASAQRSLFDHESVRVALVVWGVLLGLPVLGLVLPRAVVWSFVSTFGALGAVRGVVASRSLAGG